MAGRTTGTAPSSLALFMALVMAAVLTGVVGDSRFGSNQTSIVDSPEASALREARLAGKPVPIPELMSETAEFTALPNGDVSVTISAGVVRVRRGAGWVPVDLTLVRAADGSVAPVAHPNDLRISGGRPEGAGPEGAPARELAAVGTGARRVAMGWPGPLPEPVLSGNRATYVDALPGVDLVVEATRVGFEQLLVVKERAAAARVARVRLPLTGPGIASSTWDADGGLSLKDAAGSVVATVPVPAMWDARKTPAGGPARTVPIGTTVDSVVGGAALTLTPDLEWLRDPATTYPVILDPTVNPLSTTFDTYVREGLTTDQGGQPDLQIGLLATSPPTINRSFLSWDTSMLAGKQINSATISFWSFWSHSCTPYAWEIWTTDVASADTRFANQPAWRFKEATSTATRGHDNCDDAWVTIDGKSFFQRAATGGGTRGFMGIRATDETNVNSFKQFRSRNATSAAEVPKAVVTYNSWPTVTARATDPATACVVGAGRPLVNTLTPQLKATVSDGDATAMSVKFEWWAVDGAAPIGSATVTGVASGATAATTVPAGAFVDGGAYRWRVQASDGVADSAVWSSFCEMTVYVLAPPAEGCTAGVDSDYNGDGVRDIAIADPEATVTGKEKAGLVRVVYGGTGTVQTIMEDNARVQSGSEAGDQFGYSLATYDANRDGCGDLVVGTPYEDLSGLADVGSVYVLLGAPGGLTTGPESLTWHQDRGTFADAIEAGDWFGYSVAAGKTSAGEAYALVGAPGEDLGAAVDSGFVHYVRGSVNVGLDQAVTGSTDTNETDDRFGYSVSGSAYHIVAGRPGEGRDSAPFAGAISLYTHELVSGRPKWIADKTDDGAGQPNAFFGKSVAMVAYRPTGAAVGDPYSFLVVGAPGDDAGARDAGKLHRYHVTATWAGGVDGVTQGVGGLSGRSEEGDYFGERVVVVNTRPNEIATPQTLLVAVAVPGQDLPGAPDAGAVHVFGAADNPVSSSVVVQRGTAGLPGTPAGQELVGIAAGASAQHLYVASPYGDPAVYALAWSDLAAGTVTPAQTWQPGQGGIPAGEVAFGAATS